MIRVLVVEDDQLTAQAHAAYVERLDGFEVGGVARTAREARALLDQRPTPVELVLLDLTLPDASGLDLARYIRASGIDVDIIAVTAVRQIDTVQTAMSFGAMHYLIKPFAFASFRDKLTQYAAYRAQRGAAGSVATQSEVDELLAAFRSPAARSALPKGLSAPTLDAVSAHIRAASAPASAAEVGDALLMSRVTARRYLEHLADNGVVERQPRYGSPGRPEVAYRSTGTAH
ncbi:response regulator [Amnibacterium flavum]|uniref:Transcriptional regulatory protein n=1 Tax=Amnibacterium flavum TaxID=2173173 RepID=A0A2V1HRZ1_9MICO|nr:response regulator [Amnibacterium flavum]PVZ93869.1 two-component system response regulator [Amnibacterium flavum]